MSRYSNEQVIEFYKEILNNERKCFPKIFNENLTQITVVARYLFEDILNYSLDDIYENLTEDFLIEWRVNNIVKGYFKSHYEFIKYIYPEKKIYPWLFKLGARHYTQDDNLVKDAIEWLIEKYNITIDDVYEGKITRDIFKKNKLDSILMKRFNNSMKEYFAWYYNNFTETQFDMSKSKYKTSNYYSEAQCIQDIRNYFHSLGFNENDKSEENKMIIIKNFTKELLFRMISIQVYKNLGSSNYSIFKKVFPLYRLYPWEITAPKMYWADMNNRNCALRELIESQNIWKDDIPKFLTYDNLKGTRFAKFNAICSTYYKSDYFNWVQDVFPNEYNKEDFHPHFIFHDGYKMHSKIEVRIHNFLKQKFDQVRYIEKTDTQYHFYNKDFEEKYIPDWIVDGNIIIEYFGWYQPKSTNEKFKIYTEKANRKTDFYNNFDGYLFSPIYPNDRYDLDNWLNKIKINVK